MNDKAIFSRDKSQVDIHHLDKDLHYQWIQEPQEAIFQKRLNRFVCQIERKGKPNKVYLPNSGRLEELLIPGAPVIIEKRRKSGKTLHDLLLVQSPRFPDGEPIWVGLDSRLPPVLLRWLIESKQLEVVNKFHSIKNEPRSGMGRFDLEIQGETCTYMVETKSVNLVDATGVARFPDAPTSRGVRHVQSLIDLQSEAIQPCIVFIVMRQDAIAFSPFLERDHAFAENLLQARDAGVKILALKFAIGKQQLDCATRFSIKVISDLEVLLPGTPFPGFWSVQASPRKKQQDVS